MSEKCEVRKDFIRHIVNKVLSEALDKIPASALSELRKRFGRAEDKYKFAMYGGDPSRIVDFFRSDDWSELVDYAEKFSVIWVLEEILRRVVESYRYECPEIADIAKKEYEKLSSLESGQRSETINIDQIYRQLKYAGFKVSKSNNEIIVEEPYLIMKAKIVDDYIEYSICKLGKARNIDSILTKIEKIRDL